MTRDTTAEDRAATAAVAGTAILLAGFSVFYLGDWGDADTRRFLTDLVHVPVSLVLTLLGLRVVLRGRHLPRAVRAWAFITAAFGAKLIGETTWFIEDAVLGDPPYPAVADYFFLAFVPLMFTGLLMIPAGRRSRIDRIKLTLDALIVCSGTFMALWYLLIGPIVVEDAVPAAQTAFAAAQPVGDLLMVLAVAGLLLRSSGDVALRLLAAAVALTVVGDVAYGYLQLHAGFAGGMWPDLIWLAAAYLLILAAHRTYRQDHGDPARARRRTGLNWLPYVAIALAYGILGYLARGQGLYPLGGMIIGAVVMTALVVARQMYVLRENGQLAVTDPLTGLANRTLVNDRVAALIAQPARAGRCGAVVVIDLDRFKPVNDTYGHEAGDAVLQAVAVALRSVLRAGDTAGRLGGDEFAVVLRDLPDRAAAERIAQRLAEALRTPVVIGDTVLEVGASVGVVVHEPGEPVTVDQLLGRADLAMYVAKRSGRSRHLLYRPDLDADARDAELRRAIEDGQLLLHYQPAVALDDAGSDFGEIVAVEALVRWEHPEHGLLLPGAFIDLAEETGAVIPLGEWVLREACRQGAAWRADVPGADRLLLSVNLSPQQVKQAGFVDLVTAVLDETGFPAGRLVLEITESVALEPDEQTVARLEALRARGVRLAVDDFGTGYSALSYLDRLPVSILKIDRSFVTGITTDPRARRIAEAVIRLGQAFGLRVVAEGIETAEHARLLADLGCAFGQGYHFHRPLPAAATARVLQTLSRAG